MNIYHFDGIQGSIPCVITTQLASSVLSRDDQFSPIVLVALMSLFWPIVAMMQALQDINEIYECEQPEEPESMEWGS